MKNTFLSLLMILCSHLPSSNAAAAPVQGTWAGEKTSFTLDLSMRVGALSLSRSP